MNAFKEIVTAKEFDYLEKNRETDRPVLRKSDVSRLSDNTKTGDNQFSNFSDIFDAAFKKFGLATDSSDTNNFNSSEFDNNKDYSKYLEKGNDGRYYCKETGKTFDSIEAWKKHQETLAKRYDSTSKYYEEKAQKEWARFKNAEENGESDAEKWEHYRRSQEYYAKSKECKYKSNQIREKLEQNAEAKNDNSNSDVHE